MQSNEKSDCAIYAPDLISASLKDIAFSNTPKKNDTRYNQHEIPREGLKWVWDTLDTVWMCIIGVTGSAVTMPLGCQVSSVAE